MKIELKLIDELFEMSSIAERCPYIRRDDSGRPYCGKGLTNDSKVNATRKMVCDIYSLQLWCLNSKAAQKCIYYQGESLD